MKKNIIVILSLIIFQVSFSQKENGNKITYKLINETERAKDLPNNYKRIFSGISDIRKKLNFDLIYTKNKSAFYIEDIDLPNVNESALALAANIMFIGEFYYKDKQQAYYYKDDDNVGMYYKINYTNQDFKWKIQKETKKILGYTCRKAIGYDSTDLISGYEEKVEVWFTTELPYGYGPKNYFNLPGIVLEATCFSTNKVTYKAVKIGKNVKIKFPKDKKVKKTFTPETYWDFHVEQTDLRYGK